MLRSYKKIFAALALAIGFAACTGAAALKIGAPAPGFTAQGSDGKTYALADYKGKFVVLQWYNRDCPFTRKFYDRHDMPTLQGKYGRKGVAWFEVISSASGTQGYLSAADAQANRAREGSKALATLLDPDGVIGRLYSAKTTPHVFVIDPKGVLIYNGAIDDHASADPADIPKSKNYVAAALNEAMAGKPVTTSLTRPYGCSVKYR